MKTNKQWCICFISLYMFFLLVIGAIVIIVDPFIHYHKPLKSLYYSLDASDASINDGIGKFFEYNTIITGTSMTQNFKTSEADKLFQIESIKLPLAGATYKVVNEQLQRILSYNPKTKYVFRGLDLGYFSIFEWEKPHIYPTYLYDKEIFNDVYYIYNKDVFLKECIPMLYDAFICKKAGGIRDFDSYSSWSSNFGKEFALKGIDHFELQKTENRPLSQDLIQSIIQNIEQNVSSLPKKYPNTTFYFFLTPYSAVWWGNNYSNIPNFIEQEKIVIELILECKNVKLYSFNNEIEITTNLNNYRDPCHYGERVNSIMLEFMKEDRGLLTKENYISYLENEKDFYINFDYNSLFTQSDFQSENQFQK